MPLKIKADVPHGECISPDCLIPVQGLKGRYCEHSQPFKECFKPKPYSAGCAASKIPGATCMSPECDCD